MKRNIKVFVVASMALSATFACAHKKEAGTDSASRSSQSEAASQALQDSQVSAAAELKAAYVGTMNFDKGSVHLSAKDQERLAWLVQDASAQGIKEIKVVAWADQNYPAPSSGKKLSPSQRELAKLRAQNIRDYLKESFSVKDVDTYNMAERPLVIEEILNTSDAKVKTALETAGVTSNPEIVNGQTSQALVMVITE